MRLLGLDSSEWGRDWSELVQEIDQKIEDHGFELSGQDILLEFKHWPNISQVMIYRSIIGPLKVIERPFILTDWESRPVTRFELKSHEWSDLFAEISQIRTEIDGGSDFIIVFSRRLTGELHFKKQVLFR